MTVVPHAYKDWSYEAEEELREKGCKVGCIMDKGRVVGDCRCPWSDLCLIRAIQELRK